MDISPKVFPQKISCEGVLGLLSVLLLGEYFLKQRIWVFIPAKDDSYFGGEFLQEK
jgi:hypothetical protein